jgi:TadE-like protein
MLHSVQGSKRNGRLLRSVFPCAAKGAFRLCSSRAGRACGPKGRRNQGERGASIVEFAMVLPLFVGLLMGFIDFGLNLNNISSVRQAVREGARDVAVGEPGDAECTLSPGVDDAATTTVNESNLKPKTKTLLCGIKLAVPSSSIRVRLSYPDGQISGKKGLILCSIPSN